MLSTILIGNNIVNISASALATVLATNLFGSYAIGIATGILTLVVLIFGEIVPKTVAKLHNDKIALLYAPIIELLCIVLTPIVFIIDKLSNLFLRILGIDPNKKVVSITESELLSYVDAGHKDGVVEEDEKEIIHNVFEFSDALAKDIMIPRVDMVMTDVDATYDDVFTIFKNNMYTRIPVYENTNDNIVGIINIKDFLLIEDKEKFKIKDIMRQAYYTYEYKNTSDLLAEMREKSEAITIVLNEYGASEGMITMEDLLEEIVGEIRDEYDGDEKNNIKKLSEYEYLIEGSMKLDDINDQLDLELDSQDYDSIGGLIIQQLDDRLPKAHEKVKLEDGIVLKAERIENNRITLVRMQLPKEKPETVPNNEKS
jgi:CBS domain containing-hemolysin-like protein